MKSVTCCVIGVTKSSVVTSSEAGKKTNDELTRSEIS
jgi:hypothetical protein